MITSRKFNSRGKTVFISVILVSIGIFIRLWLIYHHFPHYDDLWGYYRASHIKLLSQEEFFSKLPQIFGSYSEIFTTFPLLEWILRHLVSVREATYQSTLAPLHYLISLLPVGFAKTYPSSLAEARIVTLFEFILFLIFFTFVIYKQPCAEKPFLIGFALLSLFASLPLYYSVQAHNYMAGLAASVGYLIVLQRPCSVSVNAVCSRAFIYSLCILASYNFILLLPSFWVSELYIYSISPSSAQISPRVKRLGLNKIGLNKILYIMIILSVPLAISLVMKTLYIMPNVAGSGWNSGFNNEYIVSYDSLSRFLGNIFYSFSSTLASLYLPSSTSYFSNTILFCLLIPLILLGLVSTIFFIYPCNAADVFSSVSVLTFFCLYILGQIAISPTRHSLILYAFIAIVASRGISVARYCLRALADTSHLRTARRSIPRLANALVLLLLFPTILYYIHAISDEINARRDPLTVADISEISKSNTLYYDEYYNYSLAIAPELRHMKEEMISWPGRQYPVIKKSVTPAPDTGDVIFYATNSFEDKDLSDLYRNILSSSGCISLKPLQPFLTHVSRKIVDAPPAPLTNNGTSSVRVFKTVCVK